MKKSLLILVMILTLALLGGCSSKNKLDIASGDNYIVAIDVDDAQTAYHLSAGTYTFDITNKELGKATMYDVYVRDEWVTSISDLGEPDYTVGGVNSLAEEIELESGQYVYIVSCDLLYEPSGYLTVVGKK